MVHCAVVMPPKETAQHRTDDGCDEPVALFIAGDHPHCFLFFEDAVGGETKGTHHGRFRAFFPILQDLQDGVAAQASATPDMDEQQKTASEQPTALPTVQIVRGAKETA